MIKWTSYGPILVPEPGRRPTRRASRLGGRLPVAPLVIAGGAALAGIHWMLSMSSHPKAPLARRMIDGVTGLLGLSASFGGRGESGGVAKRLSAGILGALVVANVPMPEAVDAPRAVRPAVPETPAAAVVVPKEIAPIDSGDLRLRILGTKLVAKERGARPILVVDLAVMNTNPIRKFDQFVFYGSSCRLTDNFGNSYERLTSARSSVELVKGSLYPGETIVLPLSFQPHIGLAKTLTLELASPEADSGPNRIRFQIPVDGIPNPETPPRG